jgi:hypothetical protein
MLATDMPNLLEACTKEANHRSAAGLSNRWTTALVNLFALPINSSALPVQCAFVQSRRAETALDTPAKATRLPPDLVNSTTTPGPATRKAPPALHYFSGQTFPPAGTRLEGGKQDSSGKDSGHLGRQELRVALPALFM